MSDELHMEGLDLVSDEEMIVLLDNYDRHKQQSGELSGADYDRLYQWAYETRLSAVLLEMVLSGKAGLASLQRSTEPELEPLFVKGKEV